MDLCLIFRRERLGIFRFLLLLENESLESIVLILETGSYPFVYLNEFFFFEEKSSFGLRVCPRQVNIWHIKMQEVEESIQYTPGLRIQKQHVEACCKHLS